MKFALHRLRTGPELVCRLQTDLIPDTPYILCAPVVPAGEAGRLLPTLHVPVSIAGEPHVIEMAEIVAIEATALGETIGTAAPSRDEIVRALDLLVSGF